MKHECKITVLDTKCFPEYQEAYLADPKSGPCPFFKKGDTFLLKRTPQQDDFYHLMNGKFCGEAWDAVSRYVYAALQGGSIMKGWTNDDRMMIACCNDGTRPVIFKIERASTSRERRRGGMACQAGFLEFEGIRPAYASTIIARLADASGRLVAFTLAPQCAKARWTSGSLQISKLYHPVRTRLLN